MSGILNKSILDKIQPTLLLKKRHKAKLINIKQDVKMNYNKYILIKT